MAKTFRNLWPQIVSWDNLVLAYRKCRRRKRNKLDAVRFDFEWESNLLELQQRLLGGSYQPGPYRHFLIYDPKRRKISAAPFVDRVVHHAVVNVLESIYERQCASRSATTIALPLRVAAYRNNSWMRPEGRGVRTKMVSGIF